ncbi:unnamed protein product [Caenorhabditis auriculariae]|uniref:ShKT domain-containing protein n=1 Tax=Caenorhabditis auriculariae TaxID=2777116 RepID=A0A8S1HBN9_9PELO|nr:unnamed protein product [Caenorhabditis auriculariae]
MRNATLILLLGVLGSVLATWTLSGYACNQPQIYNQCNCQSFCSAYQPPCGGGCGSYGGGYGGTYNGGGGGGGFVYRRRKTHRHKKKKFRFDTISDESSETLPEISSAELPEPEVPDKLIEGTTERVITDTEAAVKEAEEVFEREKSKPKDHTWDNEDLWEKKFVHGSTKSSDDDLPEISSAELETQVTRAPAPAAVAPAAVAPAGQGIGVNTGLGIGAPGIGGLGGGGGLFGISSGLGIGIPGVGPIGKATGTARTYKYFCSNSSEVLMAPFSNLVAFVVFATNCCSATFGSSLMGYACNQQAIYNHCRCQNLCRPFRPTSGNCASCSSDCNPSCQESLESRSHEGKKKFKFDEYTSNSEESASESTKEIEGSEEKTDSKSGGSGLFGIGGGLGVGVPGVGPIGVSSGLGVG